MTRQASRAPNQDTTEEVRATLENLSGAEDLTDWMFAQFEDVADGRVVEIGAGIGTFSTRILDRGATELLLVEPESTYAEALAALFSGESRVRIVEEGLPDSPSLAAAPNYFDFALCQNVLEHIEDDKGALQSILQALRPGAELGLLVPAHPMLYGRLDHAFGHHRRYRKPQLRSLLQEAGFEVEKLYSFNLLGVPGWWMQNRRPNRAAEISATQLRIYERLLRLWRPLESRVHPPAGLSLIAQARKPA